MAIDPASAGADLLLSAEQPAQVEQSTQDALDIHLLWERQLLRLDRLNLRLTDERLLDEICEEMARLEDRLLTTPARTLDGAMAQIRQVAALLAQGDSEEREQQGLHLALATLVSLRRD